MNSGITRQYDHISIRTVGGGGGGGGGGGLRCHSIINKNHFEEKNVFLLSYIVKSELEFDNF
jgi:hypothetical protein